MLAGRQREFFAGGATRDVAFRKAQLARLRASVVSHEAAILAALKQDLGRAPEESYLAEIAVVLREIDAASRNVGRWARPQRVRTPLALLPGSSRVEPEPYGTVLILAPWNYPFQLAIAPLVAAIAAGNCAVVKPSELAPRTSHAIARMLSEAFDPRYVAVVEGGRSEAQALLAERFDFIFFTGAAHVAREVMAAAAKHLTPVALELGGKNPCIVAADADLEVAARRIAWGKFMNAGQTCIAPDFVLVDAKAREALVDGLRRAVESFYGKDPKASPDYARVIDERHFDRLAALLAEGRAVVGGETDRAQRYVAPTVLEGVTREARVMQEEIFGPILPVIAYDDLGAELERLRGGPAPLALYCFSRDAATQRRVLESLPSGGACVNDVFGQFLNLRLPFGGRGESGMGAYHGRAGFDTFSHRRAVVRRATWLDPAIRYAPYKTPLAVLRRIVSFLL